MFDLSSSRLLEYFPQIILPAFAATFQMLLLSLGIGLFIGFWLAVILVITSPKGLSPNALVYGIVDFIVSFVRSFPILILIVAIAPLTRILIGVSFGIGAAIVPLSIGISAIIARLFETALNEVNPSVIDAARSFGASNMQIVFRVMLVEAMPSIVSSVTFAMIQLLNSTTVAGVVGAGGLGAVALTYGDQRFDYPLLYFIVLIFCVIVLSIQGIGNRCYRAMRKRGA